MKTWKPDKTKLIKEIIKDNFSDRISALQFEEVEIRKHINNPLNENYAIPNTAFYKTGKHTNAGMTTVKDENGKLFKISINDPLYTSGQYEHMNAGKRTGKTLVKDENGNKLIVSIDDPRYANGELVHYNVGHIKSLATKIKISDANKKYVGEQTSTYGTIWIHCDELIKNKRIKKDTEIPDGWLIGRKIYVKRKQRRTKAEMMEIKSKNN
jgi:hypothetical protein